MRGALTIARMTVLEARRNKITWSLLFFCLVLVFNSFLFQEVTIAAHDRILRDVGLAAIGLFGLLLSVFLGVSVVSREVERRTVYILLTKPIGRADYLLGKLLGVWLTLILSLGMMFVAFLLESVLYRAPIDAVVFQCFWLMLMEFLLIASFSILASTFTSSAMSAFMSIGLYLIGHLSTDLQFFASKSDSEVTRTAGALLYYLLPNLERLNLKTPASLMATVPASQVIGATGYAALYVAAFFALAVALFRRRDMK